MSRRPPNAVVAADVVSAAVASKPRNVKPLGVPTLPEIFPDATIVALPTPRLSAWMPVEFTPLEVIVGPLQVTLAE
jgi:hypothetical protein